MTDIASDPTATAETASTPRTAERAPALPWDWSSAWMAAMTAAAMAFLATLVLALHAGVAQLSHSWTGALDRQATVMLTVSPEAAERDRGAALLDRAVQAIRQAPGVTSIQALPPETTDLLLQPWLGSSERDLLSLRLIDLGLAEPTGSAEGRRTLETLDAALREAGIEAEIDGHGEWMDKLRPAAQAIEALAGSALFVIAAACALMIALACSTSMAAQARIIDVLRLIGAYDGYIAGLFVRRFQILTFTGGAIGAGLGVLALFAGPLGVDAPEEPGALAPLIPDLTLDAGLWARFAVIPLGLALIATLTARLSVEARLRRLEG